MDTLAANGVIGSTVGTKYVVLKAPNTSFDNGAAALLLDQMFDDGNLNTGAIRYRICVSSACTPTSNADTLKYLLMPMS